MSDPAQAEATAWLRARAPDWPSLLADMRGKPGMWTGGKTIAVLRLYRDGLQHAEMFHAIPVDRRLGGFNFVTFEEWVDARFNTERLSVDSFWLAANLPGSDAAGFDRWFEWYDEFNASTQHQ